MVCFPWKERNLTSRVFWGPNNRTIRKCHFSEYNFMNVHGVPWNTDVLKSKTKKSLRWESSKKSLPRRGQLMRGGYVFNCGSSRPYGGNYSWVAVLDWRFLFCKGVNLLKSWGCGTSNRFSKKNMERQEQTSCNTKFAARALEAFCRFSAMVSGFLVAPRVEGLCQCGGPGFGHRFFFLSAFLVG